MSNRAIGHLSRYLRARPVCVTITVQSRRFYTPKPIFNAKIEDYLKDLGDRQKMKHRSQGFRAKGSNQPKKQKQGGDYNFGKGEDPEQVLQNDINRLLESAQKERDSSESPAETPKPELPQPFSELDVTISSTSSSGDGLALSEDGSHVYVVPFTIPGDKATIKIVRHLVKEKHSITDLVKVNEPGPGRDDSLIKCKYFGECSGCQLQMLPYKEQLKYKKKVVEKAYANFSGLIPEVVPAIGDTFPSPLQYGYRTKLTPHYAAPPKRSKNSDSQSSGYTSPPAIGFHIKNRRVNVDIEDCPLGTDIIRKGLKNERERVLRNYKEYHNGATILLRQTTRRLKKDDYDPENPPYDDTVSIYKEHPEYVEEQRYVTNQNGYSTEYIDDFILGNKSGAFFQNNNSILSPFTEYIRQQIHPKTPRENEKPIKYLIDAYSGCGLFTVTLSTAFKSSLGIDIDVNSIECARENANKNNLPNTGFAAADAPLLFKRVPYPPDETFLVIDPPRKGCSEDFLKQLLRFGPRRVAYVSCNVHTQARDVGYMVEGNSDSRYEIESIRGFDFFPQTSHVEGLAILNKVPKDTPSEEK
ncbi:hypothetical protein PISL3812_01597 [Talaromyces islandicus]|uniref:tRNA (uracil(54)-C(5))-methyltransferase n=1 Tax=Talaromyces islandicus TaxID=28573 RepID=A0A0U1LMK0_TALIS|nr:hypothetical protein PISL3812_01597 [Talaromyces islandicus]